MPPGKVSVALTEAAGVSLLASQRPAEVEATQDKTHISHDGHRKDLSLIAQPVVEIYALVLQYLMIYQHCRGSQDRSPMLEGEGKRVQGRRRGRRNQVLREKSKSKVGRR